MADSRTIQAMRLARRNRIGGSGIRCGSSAIRRRSASIAMSPSNRGGSGGASLLSPPLLPLG